MITQNIIHVNALFTLNLLILRTGVFGFTYTNVFFTRMCIGSRATINESGGAHTAARERRPQTVQTRRACRTSSKSKLNTLLEESSIPPHRGRRALWSIAIVDPRQHHNPLHTQAYERNSTAHMCGAIYAHARKHTCGAA